MTQSIPYQISRHILAALKTAPVLAGATLHDNPTTPAALTDGDRVLFLEDGTDAPLDEKSGQKEFRSFVLSIGVIARGSDCRAIADATMVDAKTSVVHAWNGLMNSLTRSGKLVSGSSMREGQRMHKIEGVDVGGALIVTAFEFQYREAFLDQGFRTRTS